MTDLLTTFKAAKLAGVSRADFQKRILSGELNTFEGKIRMGDLVKVFPKVSQIEDPTIKRMEDIKNAACVKDDRTRRRQNLPDAECLMDKLEKLSDAFLARHNQALKQEKVIHEALFNLEQLAELDAETCKIKVETLADWLFRELEDCEEQFEKKTDASRKLD